MNIKNLLLTSLCGILFLGGQTCKAGTQIDDISQEASQFTRGSWERFRVLEKHYASIEDVQEQLPGISLPFVEWRLLGSLCQRKAHNLHCAREKGFILTDWVWESLSFGDVYGVGKIDGNSTDHQDNNQIVAVCGNKVAVYRDTTVPCIRLFNLEDGAFEDWDIPVAIYWEGGLSLTPSHNENFFILKTDKTTYLADIGKKEFVPIPFVWEGRTPRVDLGPPLIEISPLLVPANVWRERKDVLNYQPFIASIIKCSSKQDHTGEDIPDEFDTHRSSRIFFHPLRSDVQGGPQLEYLDYFTSGVMGKGGKPACLRVGSIYTLNSERLDTPCLLFREDEDERSFHSNVDPYYVYFLELRAADKHVPKVRVVGGWQTGETYHLLTEEEVEALETDVSAFIPNPQNPNSLLSYATKPARLFWKVPQRTCNSIISERLVTLLNSLQAKHGYDFYPLPTSSQDPESLVFRGEKVDSTTILVVNPFQEPLKTMFVNCEDPPYHFSLLSGRCPKKEVFSLKASDGTPLHGYVTHPFKRLPHNPGLLLIHGGPAFREEWDGGGENIFYASRGYTVLTLNYRGSSGYGRKFEQALYQNYGTVDLEDNMAAINHAAEQKWVNPRFMVVGGGSYGAYAAIRMVEKFPDSFKGVIAENGLYDMAEWIATEREKSLMVRYKGLDPLYVEDKERLDKQSALSEVRRIKVPSLILHGDEDTICPIKHSVALVEEMKKHGKEVCFVRFEGGKHTLTDLGKLRVAFLLRDLFLARTLQGYGALPTDEFKNAPGAEILEGASLLGLEGWDQA